MKKFFKSAIALCLVLSLVFSLAACGGNKDDEDKVTVTSIKVKDGTYPKTLEVGETPDFSNIKVEVTLSDGTTKEVGITEVTLSNIDTSTEGVKKLEVTYEGKTASVNITVGDPEEDVFIAGIELPQNIVTRESYKNNFKDSTLPYYVGDDNPYLFYVNVMMFDSNDDPVDVDSKTYPTSTRVFLIDDETSQETELTGDALTAMVVKDEANNTYDFTEAAIGKTFRLEIKPLENYNGAPKSQVVRVVDGYNVYNAKELNLLTNQDDDVAGSAKEEDVSQIEAVNRFLAANGITRPQRLTGLILHQDLSITLDDIPSEYIFEYEKNGEKKKALYDNMYVYYHINRPDSETESSTFSFYGNYYSIYSYDIPNVVEKGVANNEDAFSNGSLFRFSAADYDDEFAEGYNHKNFTTNIIGLGLRDNNPHSNDQAAIDRHMLGLICIIASYQEVNVINTNIEAYTITMMPYNDDLTVNLDKVKFFNAWQGHLFIWNSNTVQDEITDSTSGQPREEYQNIKINITDSTLAKCGGPVILSQNSNPGYEINSKSGADIVVDDKSVLYSYVTGQEAWFVGVGQSQLVMLIMSLDNQIANAASQAGVPASFISNKKIQDVSTINMIYVNMGVGTDVGGSSVQYGGSFTRAGQTLNTIKNNPWLDAYLGATGGAAPVFQSSAGGTAFSDGESSCYGIESGSIGAPTSNFFEGDYLSLYYMGIGILLDYYH